MTAISADLVGETGTYNSTGPVVDMGGTAATGLRTFAAASTAGDLTDGDTIYVTVKKDDTNMATWEATWNDAATDHIDRVSELTAIGTLSNSDSVTVYMVNPAEVITSLFTMYSSHFVGGQLIFTDDDTVQLGPGQAVIGSRLYSWTSNITSGNLGQSDPGLSAEGIWHWYLYDNAGTMTIEYNQTNPVQASDKTYWHKSGDTSRRWVGWHSVYLKTTTRYILPFWSSSSGNNLEVQLEGNSTNAIPPRIIDDSTPPSTLTLTTIAGGSGGTFDPDELCPVGPSEWAIVSGKMTMLTLASGNYWQATTGFSGRNTNTVGWASITMRACATTDGGLDGFFYGPIKVLFKNDVDIYHGVSEIDGTTRLISDIHIVGARR